MRIGLIGAGHMAAALARGWGEQVLCCDAGSGRAAALAQELGGRACDTAAEVAAGCELLVLAHKPAGLAEVAAGLSVGQKPVVSLLGGVTLSALRESYPEAALFRVMPNVAVAVRRGMTCIAADSAAPAELSEQIAALFGRVGRVLSVEEAEMDAVTALSGVGPAYQALLVEAQVDAAVRHGLRPALAAQLVTETMAGTAVLLEGCGYDTLEVRRQVTSPGGSTARGLAALERAGVRGAFQQAIDAVLRIR